MCHLFGTLLIPCIVAAPTIDLNAQTMDCSIWLAFIRLVTKPRLSKQSAVCTRKQTSILSNRRNTFFDHQRGPEVVYNRDRRMRDNHKYGSQEEQNNDEFMIK